MQDPSHQYNIKMFSFNGKETNESICSYTLKSISIK